MQRITKRNEHGGIDIDGVTLALEKLAEYEDTGIKPYEAVDYKNFFTRAMENHSCNDCACVHDCKHAPEWGDFTRINCFAWEGESTEEKEPREIKAYGLNEPDPNFE